MNVIFNLLFKIHFWSSTYLKKFYVSMDVADESPFVIAAKSPFVPPEATEEVLLWIPGVILNLIDKDYNVDLACSDFFGILFWLGDKVVSVYMRVADGIQWLLAKDTTVVKHYFFFFRVLKGSGPDEEEEDMPNYDLTGQEGLLKVLDTVLENYNCFSVQSVLENVKKKEQVLDDFGAREVSLIDLELGKKKEMMEGWFHVIICYLYIE
ncbi:Protein EARLY-RESPONSIVE TO DEHYDRATION 7, chloroplastic [Glycine soja]